MYNVPSYKEINPAVFSIVTYPFLFSVMYGDWGHGCIFLVPALFLVFGEPYLRSNKSLKLLLKLRYLILMTAIFTIWNGLVYNEFFAISTDFFGTCFATKTDKVSEHAYGRLPYKSDTQDCVYAFGMDPAWALSSNQKLGFMNTNKEKLSVIIAFVHLNIGVICKGLNSIYFGRWKVLFFDVLTGIFIFFGIIGVMITLIFAKWWYPVNAYTPLSVSEVCSPENPEPTVCTSPSIITVTINNFMQVMGSKTPENQLWFSGQQTFANIFVVAAVICIPLMLFVIPCLTLCKPAKADKQEPEFT